MPDKMPDKIPDPSPYLKRFEASGKRLVYLSAERTLLTWIRAGLTLMALGFVVDRLGLILLQMQIQHEAPMPSERFSFWAGSGLVLLGSIMNFFAGVRYHLVSKKFDSEVSSDIGSGLQQGVVFTFIIGIIGLLIMAYLAKAAI